MVENRIHRLWIVDPSSPKQIGVMTLTDALHVFCPWHNWGGGR